MRSLRRCSPTRNLVDTPNTVLRRLLGLEGEAEVDRAAKLGPKTPGTQRGPRAPRRTVGIARVPPAQANAGEPLTERSRRRPSIDCRFWNLWLNVEAGRPNVRFLRPSGRGSRTNYWMQTTR